MNRAGILSISHIYGDEKELEKIRNTTDVEAVNNEEGKVVDYKIRPTKRELKDLLNSYLFEEGKTLKIIKVE